MAVGIPTTRVHTNFRSRLEARWAIFFDLIGWSWVYEPLDADGYIPDFLIQGERPLFIEVGPCITRNDYDAKTTKPNRAAHTLRHDVMVVGVSPLASMDNDGQGDLVAGLLGEFWGCPLDCQDPSDHYFLFGDDGAPIVDDEGRFQRDPQHLTGEFSWATGSWHRCHPDCGPVSQCGRIAVHHSVDSYASRPCGHHDGDHHLGWVDKREIEQLWREAGNRVQWRPG